MPEQYVVTAMDEHNQVFIYTANHHWRWEGARSKRVKVYTALSRAKERMKQEKAYDESIDMVAEINTVFQYHVRLWDGETVYGEFQE